MIGGDKVRGTRRRDGTGADAEVSANEAFFRSALALRGIKRRAADKWLVELAETVADEPAGPSDAYVAHVLTEEGVTDIDVRWYWSLGPHVHAFFKMLDNLDHLALFSHLQSTQSPADAATQVRRSHPYYGDPRSPALAGQGHEDRLIPWELRDRVDVYLQRRSVDVDSLLSDRAASTTFNALVRDEIAAGRL
jgi:hypothetical protein